eukprot:Nitzschia sp. Nitz4//scaffold93_size78505//16056//17033//NITZ4_005414-RA/size78505-processed-gene-0.83-mRNA-1//1//CDS//3329560270//2623//frame0
MSIEPTQGNNSSSPFSRYGTLAGELFLYAQGRAAFETNPACPNKCILIGGLSDGMLPVPYTQVLADACKENGWSLVQPILSSSYLGFGNGSLDRDAQEMQECLKFLVDYRQAQRFSIIGHSTGCQDAIHFLKGAINKEEEGGIEGTALANLFQRLVLVALQAPVSDREASGGEGLEEMLQTASNLVQAGKGQEMMPRAAFWAPITAQRFLDLHERGGADDYFSSDYSDQELMDRLGHVGRFAVDFSKTFRVLVGYSGSDEFVPASVDSRMLMGRLVQAMNTHSPPDKPVAEGLYLVTGNHNLLTGPEDGATFVNKIMEMLKLAVE